MKKIIWVTGAAGFLGFNTVKQLALSGFKVVGFDTRTLDFKYDNILDFYFINAPSSYNVLENTEKKFGIPYAIIHCAGSGSVPLSFENPKEDFLANVSSTLDILEFIRNYSVDIKIILPSSAAVYGTAQSDPQKEDGEIGPISPYGFHKRIAEELCLSYSKNFGLQAIVIRFFSVYGEGLCKQIFWDACRKALNREYYFSGNGTEIRDFLHVSDAVRLLVMAIGKATAECPIVNGGTGTGTSIKNILTEIGKYWGMELQPVFSGDNRPGDPVHYIADISVIKTWGFAPQTNINNAIAEYIKWFQRNYANE